MARPQRRLKPWLKAAAVAATGTGLWYGFAHRNPWGWAPALDKPSSPSAYVHDAAYCSTDGTPPPPPPKDATSYAPAFMLALAGVPATAAALMWLLSLGAAGGVLRATVHSLLGNRGYLRWLAATRGLLMLVPFAAGLCLAVANMNGRAVPNPALHGAPCAGAPGLHPRQQCCTWRQDAWTWPFMALVAATSALLLKDAASGSASDTLSGAVVQWYFSPAGAERGDAFDPAAAADLWRCLCGWLGPERLQQIDQGQTRPTAGASCAYGCLSFGLALAGGLLAGGLYAAAAGWHGDAALLAGFFTWFFSFVFLLRVLNQDLLYPVAARIRFCCVVEQLAAAQHATGGGSDERGRRAETPAGGGAMPSARTQLARNVSAAFREQAAAAAAHVPLATAAALPALVHQPDGRLLLGATGRGGGPADIEASLLPSSPSE